MPGDAPESTTILFFLFALCVQGGVAGLCGLCGLCGSVVKGWRVAGGGASGAGAGDLEPELTSAGSHHDVALQELGQHVGLP